MELSNFYVCFISKNGMPAEENINIFIKEQNLYPYRDLGMINKILSIDSFVCFLGTAPALCYLPRLRLQC